MPQTLTAAVLIIGNEILAGTTQDVNVSFIAQRLSPRGILLSEVRIVRDVEIDIVEAVNSLRKRYTYVFTTGGIGPTHDDITSASIAKAFGVRCVPNSHAKQVLEDHCKENGTTLNEARLRMAVMPENVLLVRNPVSGAPGFQIENVFVLAGVPKIMQGMFDYVEMALDSDNPILSATVLCNQREGDIAAELGKIQKEFKELEIGSYPQSQAPILKIILRTPERAHLDRALKLVVRAIRDKGDIPEVLSDDDDIGLIA